MNALPSSPSQRCLSPDSCQARSGQAWCPQDADPAFLNYLYFDPGERQFQWFRDHLCRGLGLLRPDGYFNLRVRFSRIEAVAGDGLMESRMIRARQTEINRCFLLLPCYIYALLMDVALWGFEVSLLK